MATRIRLRRVGRKGLPLYRVVVTDRTSPRDGRFIETLGNYNPKAEGTDKLQVDGEKVKSWIAKGATPTDTVKTLLTKAGLLAQA
jgi:small subunit ribosomal protein S16